MKTITLTFLCFALFTSCFIYECKRNNNSKEIKMNKFTVILVAKHSSETATMTVDAIDEENAMDVANNLIETDPQYAEYKTGWRISEAV